MSKVSPDHIEQTLTGLEATSPHIGALVGNRYQIVKLLHVKHDVETLLAVDTARDELVVARAVPIAALPAGALMQLEYEAAVLGEIKSQVLAPLLDVKHEDKWLFLIQAYIDGITLRTRLDQGIMPLQDALKVGLCLFSALNEIHSLRVLHGDIRPENVIINDQTPLTNAVLVNLDLSHTFHLEPAVDADSLGKALYRSPEQAGSLHYNVGATSELYSAGVLLFECLAGRPPYQGGSVGEILLQHMTAHALDLRSLRSDIPRALDELVQRLLRKDPGDRYQSAEAVKADLQYISDALSRGECEPSLVVGSRDHHPTLTEPSFVGRFHELEQLVEQIQHTRQGRGSLVIVESESGGGKTRLLAELSLQGAQHGMRVFHGQGSEQVGQRPFQVLAGVVNRFIEGARSDEALALRVRTQLGEHCDAAVAAIPELAETLKLHTLISLGPEAFGEARSIQALAHFLYALGTERQPALIVLDDCQWADELTAKLIGYWQSIRNENKSDKCHVMLVVGFRSEEVLADHLLRRMHPAISLRLEPFGPKDLRHLLESMAGPLPEEAINVITKHSEGSPFMATAVLRGMVESGALVAEQNGWRVEPLAMTDLHSSDWAGSFLSRRILLLPQSTIDLLGAGAILGKEFDLTFAAKLVGQSPAQAIAALDKARDRHFVWVQPDEIHCNFVHDKIRSALLENLSDLDRSELHHRVALLLRKDYPDRIFDLAYHFDAAGHSEQAMLPALIAAKQARSQHSLEIAEQQYRIAQRGVGSTGRSTRYCIAEGLGDVLMLRGRYDEAEKLFAQASEFAEEKLAQAQILGKIGELAFKRGNMEEATIAFEDTLRLLGRFVPRYVFINALLIVWEVLVQALHTLFPSFFVGRYKKPPSEVERLTFSLYSRLAHGCWYVRGSLAALWSHLRGLNLVERYPPSPELAQAYSEHAPGMTLVGYYSRGITYAEKSLALRKSFNDLWGQGQSLNFYSILLYAASKFQECVEKSREAIRLLQRTGDYWELNMARYQMAASMYRMGDLRGAAKEAQRLHQSGLDLGDEQASGISLDLWAFSTGGKVPEEALKKELARVRGDIQGKAQVLLAEGVRLMALKEFEQAAQCFQDALQLAKRSGLMNAYISPHLPWLATALRCQAERHSIYAPWKRESLLRQAEAVARRALRVTRWLKNDQPHTLREYGRLLAIRGKANRASRFFKKSLAVAQRQGAKYEYAQTQLVYSRLLQEWGRPEGEDGIATAEAALRELDLPLEHMESSVPDDAAPATLSLADRFDAILDEGRQIATALSAEMIFTEVSKAAMRLLRGEHCQVLKIRHDGEKIQFIPLAELENKYFQSELLHRALQAGRAVAFAETPCEDRNADCAPSDERSTLCVPIFARGAAVACLYAAHSQVQGLFGPDEERLGDFIATIAGAALENADGFRKLQHLNQTLELKVKERTAAAEQRAQELAKSYSDIERVANELKQTQDQLLLAKDGAESANRAKSSFLTTMSHEIRTPLNGIMGMTELALSTPLSTAQKSYLNIVKQSADCLLDLVNDVLDLSKIEAGKVELENIPFDLREMVGDATQVMAFKAFQKGLELIFQIDAQIPDMLIGDPGRLRQVLVNLLGNAVKFTERGEVFLSVRLEAKKPGSVQLHCTVHDTGIGIPKDKQKIIFQSFSQADRSMTRRFGGTGLGLFISAQLVNLMGGDIWVESEENKGSVFHVTAWLNLPKEAKPFSSPALDMFKDSPILVVNDHPRYRQIYTDLLEHQNMRPTLVADTTEAMRCIDQAAIQNTPFRMVILDAAKLGDENDGLADSLFAKAIYHNCNIIVLVPPSHIGIFDRYHQHPQIQWLTKPAKYKDLLEAIARACKLDIEPEIPLLQDAVAVSTGPLHILLVEDGLINQEVAVGLLELRKHRVDVANNGKEALEAVRRQRFDAILMDVEMPEMDGLEATAAIREIEKSTGGRIPIIAMTAHAIKGFRDRCLEVGMDDYIVKPIKPEELFKALEKVCADLRLSVP
jgi:signal transduction histidine kinase/CheY-like chemotaxis protein/serine/threonine protein kinase